MNKTFISLGISLTLEELESLKGGTAEVSNAIEESSESGVYKSAKTYGTSR